MNYYQIDNYKCTSDLYIYRIFPKHLIQPLREEIKKHKQLVTIRSKALKNLNDVELSIQFNTSNIPDLIIAKSRFSELFINFKFKHNLKRI